MIARFSCLGISLIVGLLSAPGAVKADIYVYEDKQGVRHFTNVPNHNGYRRVIRSNEPQPSRPTNSRSAYEDLIRAAAKRHSMDPNLIRAVIKVESDFNSNARSHKGAMGLMQLMPETARLHNVVDILDPRDNIEGGSKHLKLLLARFQGDLELALAAYNAGTGAVEKYGGIPPFAETRDYVQRVLRHYDAYRGNGLQAKQQFRP